VLLADFLLCGVYFAGVLEMAASESGVGFSGHTLDKATKAKVTLENYYSNLIAQHIDRKKRFVILLKTFVTWVEITLQRFSFSYAAHFVLAGLTDLFSSLKGLHHYCKNI
jgi:hypothetical protein